jgi:hypothetical protein
VEKIDDQYKELEGILFLKNSFFFVKTKCQPFSFFFLNHTKALFFSKDKIGPALFLKAAGELKQIYSVRHSSSRFQNCVFIFDCLLV